MTTEEARAAKKPAQLIQKWRGRKSALRHNPRVICGDN
jgi:hypothetical protein